MRLHARPDAQGTWGIGWTLVPDPDAVKVIERIVRELLEGATVSAIAVGLNAGSIPSPRDHWAVKMEREKGGRPAGPRGRTSCVTYSNEIQKAKEPDGDHPYFPRDECGRPAWADTTMDEETLMPRGVQRMRHADRLTVIDLTPRHPDGTPIEPPVAPPKGSRTA
ncbi:recombinase family protein [Streptomyces sp. NBC_00053]|nr:recombinase family protein [Streptomyces sp. NBC_00052]